MGVVVGVVHFTSCSLKSVGMITDEEKAVANDDPEDDNVPGNY